MIGCKNPSSTVFWNDILDDKALKACSLAARGLWLQAMLPLAASCESRPGYIIVEGKPSKLKDLPDTLAGIVGIPADIIRPLLDELVATKSVGIDGNYIFNRRMVKAHNLSGKRSAAGKEGAAATHGKKKHNPELPWQTSGNVTGKNAANTAGIDDGNGAGKTASSSFLHSSVLQESPLGAASSPLPADEVSDKERRAAPDASQGPGEENPGLAFDVGRAALLACELGGVDRGRAVVDRVVVEAWVQGGWRIDTQIEPAIRGAAARPGYTPPQSLKYFTPIIEEFVRTTGHRLVSAGRSAVPSIKSVDGRPWDKIVGDYARDQAAGKTRIFWLNDWGPKPDQSGCWAPREVLVKHGYRRADA